MWRQCHKFASCFLWNISSDKTTSRGFTLIELLVVIAIIGILASIGLASFSQVQLRARDARRMSDVQAISKALALYDVNVGAFPISTSVTTLTGTDAVSTTLISAETIPAVPKDPSYPVRAYTYQTNANGNTFTLTFCLETNTIRGYVAGCTNTIKP